jgi:hypothetical protein
MEEVMTALNRRGMLMWTGGTLVLASTGGLLRAASALDALPDGDAYSPWQLWNAPSLRNTPLALVAAAVLAANPHDTQPWLFRVKDNSIEVFADLSRNLGAMDSFVREMHLALGCAIQNALLAAGPNGYAAELTVEPGSLISLSQRKGIAKVATIALSRHATAPPDSLYRAIPERHTNRYAYDRTKAVPGEWKEFAAHADVSDDVRLFLFENGAARQHFDSAVVDATQAIITDAQMNSDSDRWFRSSRAEIDAHRDGITLDAAGLSWLTLTFAKLFPIPVPPSMSQQAWLSQTRETQVPTASLTGLIAVRDRYDRQSAIAAGRTWQRLHLSSVAYGLAMQPLNQPVEMADREKQLGRGNAWSHRLAQLTGPDWQATFSFRAGFATETAPASPRRALRDVVLR